MEKPWNCSFLTKIFYRILGHYEITPPKATATVIWEEGNLGLTCARLIGQELRFLTLVHPNLKVLEQAAEVIRAETGLAPRMFTEVPKDYHEWGIIIQCGRFLNEGAPDGWKRIPRYHLFGGTTTLGGANLDLTVSMDNRPAEGPMVPALGEAVFRACFELEKGVWCGPQLPLGRVMELERVYREVNR
ncbi:MAG TPA: hypothetical protein VHY08_24505 [Bacillota bacterium]|nr:hypothetical protein [Bacillota bacterium]